MIPFILGGIAKVSKVLTNELRVVEGSNAKQGTAVLGAALGASTLNAPTTATTGGALAAATYYYVVTALNAVGEALKSNEVSIVTTGTTSTVSLTWSAVTGATSYRVYRGTAAGAQNVFYAPGNVTSFTDTGAANTAGSPPSTNTTNGVLVSNTSVTASSRIQLTVNAPGGTVGSPYVSTRTAATSFVIVSTSSTDTSTVAYEIFEPA